MTASLANIGAMPSPLPPTSYPTSFYRYRFKMSHVAVCTAFDTTACLAYKVAEICCKIFFLKNKGYQFQQISLYFYTRMKTRLLVSIIMRKNIINFSMNCASQPRELLKDTTQELKTLKTVYGPLFERMIHGVGSPANPLPTDQLHPLAIDKDGGVCLGSSLDFASRVLTELQSQADYLKIVEHISSLFVNSVTPEGEIAQIIHNAIEHDPAEVVNDKIARKFVAEFDTLVAKIRNEKKVALSNHPFSKIHLKNTTMEVKRRLYLYISRFFNIDLKSIQYIDITNNAKTEEILSHFDSLPSGVYLVLCQKNTIGHSMTYIKESDQRAYLFNPGVGTFLVTNHVELKRALLVGPHDRALYIMRCKKKDVIDETAAFERRLLKTLRLTENEHVRNQ